MSYLEVIILSVGLSLDVCAVMACEGSKLASIRAGKLVLVSLIFCVLHEAAFLVGRAMSHLPRLAMEYSMVQTYWQGFAAAIFLTLSVIFLVRAIRRKPFFEHRSEIRFKQVIATALITSIDTLFVGFGSGFLESQFTFFLLMLFIITGCFAALGIFIGYHFGYEQKTKLYWGGCVLFLAMTVEVFFRYLF